MGRPRYELNVTDDKKNELELNNAEKTINQRIAKLRKAKRLTQKEFAEKLNVSDKLVSKWEQESSTPALEDVKNICKIFNLTLDYLINGIESISDTETLKPVPPPLPPFEDPIQKLVKKIDDLITKNKLQKFKEQLFPSSLEEALYNLVERIRKDNLKEWKNCEFDGDNWARHFKEEYCEDRRSPKKLIDEMYWGQVVFNDHFRNQYTKPKYDKSLFKHGIFILDIFTASLKRIRNGQFRIVNYDIELSIDLHAMLALDNFEIYQKLTATKVPVVMCISVPEQLKKSSGYFDLTFEEIDYYKIFESADKFSTKAEGFSATSTTLSGINSYLRYLRDDGRFGRNLKTIEEFDSRLKDAFIVRNLKKAPLTYKELLSLTDIRFLSLLKTDKRDTQNNPNIPYDIDILLEKVNIKHKRAWEVIAALIEAGATKRHGIYDKHTHTQGPEDPLLTLMLYEIAKIKTQT